MGKWGHYEYLADSSARERSEAGEWGLPKTSSAWFKRGEEQVLSHRAGGYTLYKAQTSDIYKKNEKCVSLLSWELHM